MRGAESGCVSLTYGNLLTAAGHVYEQFADITYDQRDVFVLQDAQGPVSIQRGRVSALAPQRWRSVGMAPL